MLFLTIRLQAHLVVKYWDKFKNYVGQKYDIDSMIRDLKPSYKRAFIRVVMNILSGFYLVKPMDHASWLSLM